MSVLESEQINGCPAFKRFVEGVFLRSPMQRKYLSSHFARCNGEFWDRAENFAEKFTGYLDEMGLSVEQAVEAYLEVCKDMVASQTDFKRTKKYSCPNADEAKMHIYLSDEKMTTYMIGPILTQFLWPNHYRMYDFFIEQSRKLSTIKTVLEIGPGHGLYLAESVSSFPLARIEAIDISPSSQRLSEALVSHLTGNNRCEVQLKDISQIQGGKYDYIVMGEVLEHLDDPKSALRKIRSLLSDDGYFFITTCANAPAIDHVYLYDSVEHIQYDIRESGFTIVAELALPVEDVPREQWAQRKVEVNYAAMLRKS